MSEDIKTSNGKLYIVSTPIGNKDDFTIRAMNSLKRCDFIICEEMKIGARTLKLMNLSKELIPLNEHNEVEATDEILERIKKGEKACLISDDGTPLIADPGNHFIKEALRKEIDIEVVPGVTSIITALVRSGLPTDQFLFAGFVGRKTEDKFQDVRDLSREKRTVVLLETPYRLASTLEVLYKIMPNRKAYIGMNLTHPFETHHYGTFEELYAKLSSLEIKAEFVICFEGSDYTKFHQKDDFSQEKSFNRNDFESSPQRDESGSYNHDRSGGSRDNRSGGYNRDNRGSSGGYSRDRNSGSRDDSRGGGYSRDNRGSSGGYSRDGGYKKKEYSGSGEGGYKKREYSGSGEGRYEKKEYSGSGEGGYKKKEYSSNDEGGYKKREYSGGGEGGYKKKEYSGSGEGGYKKKEYSSNDEGGYKKREYSGSSEGAYKKKEYSGGGEGGYKKKEYSGSGEGGYKKREYSGSSEGGYKKKEYSGSRDGGFKRKEFDGERKSFDRPKQDNFKDGDFENSGSYSKEYNKSSERSSERKFGDKPNYSKGDRKDSKFSSKSGGKFGSPKFGGSKSGGKKFVKRTGGSKGR